ncbi:hypothetical protein IW262DRAFT_1299238 [Armillaria fumosa]|nr:hypothetical protein IW262DRAFT_1299238 [Armillaria fumosa]
MWSPMSTLTSGVASTTHRIVQWFASYDVDDADDLHTIHSLDESSSRGGFTYGGEVPMVNRETSPELEELEKLEEQLAVRYEMVFPGTIDSVAVFDEAKARAFSERNTQSERELRQMGALHRLRLRCLDY